MNIILVLPIINLSEFGNIQNCNTRHLEAQFWENISSMLLQYSGGAANETLLFMLFHMTLI